jgi:hypothetical protein
MPVLDPSGKAAIITGAGSGRVIAHGRRVPEVLSDLRYQPRLNQSPLQRRLRCPHRRHRPPPRCGNMVSDNKKR